MSFTSASDAKHPGQHGISCEERSVSGGNREVNPKTVGSFLKTYLHAIFALFIQALSQGESVNIQLRTFLPDDPTSKYFPEITSSN